MMGADPNVKEFLYLYSGISTFSMKSTKVQNSGRILYQSVGRHSM